MTAHRGLLWILRKARRWECNGVNLRAHATHLEIENVRGYPSERVAQLRHVLDRLAHGDEVTVRPDLRRPGFFDLETSDAGFYVHLSPVSGKWYLLGVWTISLKKVPVRVSPVATDARMMLEVRS